MKRITVIVGTPQHGCTYGPLLQTIDSDADIDLDLIVCGERSEPELDTRCCHLVGAGRAIRRRIELPRAVETRNSRVTLPTHQRIAFAEALHSAHSDLVLLLGGHAEMLPAARAARTAGIPVAYLHDENGATDDHDAARELTTICHAHFVTNRANGNALIQQGEDPWRVINSGSPIVDELERGPALRRRMIERRIGTAIESPHLLITFVPQTDAPLDERQQLQNLLEAVNVVGVPTLFAYPDGIDLDRHTLEKIRGYVEEREEAHLAPPCDWETYRGLLRHITALASNADIGGVEASWLNLPRVSIGSTTENNACPQIDGVIHTGYEREEIFAALATITAKEFPGLYTDLPCPYGEGRSAEAMVVQLKNLVADDRLHQKALRPIPTVALPPTPPLQQVQ